MQQYSSCTRWHAGKSFKDENRLALFALEQQAVVGSCKEPKPWGWNIVESAKWQAWSQLQDMAPVEAMRLYVRLLEDELVSTCHLTLVCSLADSIPAPEESTNNSSCMHALCLHMSMTFSIHIALVPVSCHIRFLPLYRIA